MWGWGVSTVRDALRLILPLAKGYAHAHPVGSNARHIQEAEAVLASDDWQLIETAPQDGTLIIVFREGARGKVASIHGGLSVRDYFAAKAMAGILAWSPNAVQSGIARQSYQLADAMLAERAKP